MHNIKTHILNLCPNCGDMKIVDRYFFDHKKSVFVLFVCPKCDSSPIIKDVMCYYGKNGYLGDEERNDSTN